MHRTSRSTPASALGLAGIAAIAALLALPAQPRAQGGQPVPPWAQPQQPPQQPPPGSSQGGVPAWAQPRPPQQQQQAPAAPPSPVIARVGGRPITQLEFDRVAQPYFAMLRAQLGPSFAGDVQKIAAFNVLDELIRRELLGVEAGRQKVAVTQADVDSLLVHDPFFVTNGRFDAVKFNSYKTSPGSNYALMLPRLREMAAMRKLDETLRRRFTPTPAQVREEWARRNDQVRLKVLALLTRDMPLEPEASEAEWAQYYREHPDQFMKKTRARLRYARLPLPVEGDSTRAAAEPRATAAGKALADSLRARTLPDTSARLLDTGLFDVPATSVPGIGRAPGLTDTLAHLDADSTIRVVGPYATHDAVIVGVVSERIAKHLAPMPEVLGDVKRRADAEKRRAINEADRRAYYQAHRDTWRGTRVALTRVTLDPAGLAIAAPTAAEVERWYAQHGRALYGLADSSRAWLPPISDSLRAVVRDRLIEEQRAQRGAEAAAKLAAGLRTTKDLRALARASGAAAETLTVMSGATASDTLFGRGTLDSLLAGAMAARGMVQGPRRFGSRWALWRVDAADTAFVPTYDAVRGRSDQAFAEEKRQKDEAEARTRFDQHRTDYKTPIRYGVDYVLVRPAPPESIRISEAEIRRVYQANTSTYRQEEQVKARHILFMTRDGGRDLSPEAQAQARGRADSLLAAIRKDAGADFAGLAMRFSQEPGAQTSGGDLGWFGRGRMVKEFEDAAFALQPGQVSDVVRTQFGYHIIKVEARKAAGLRPLAEVRDEIRSQQSLARADSLARRAADALRRKLALGGDAKLAAARYGGVVTANPIGVADALPAIGFVQGLGQDLPALATGTWSRKTYRGGNGWMVLRVRQVVPPRPAEFDEVKAQAIEDMKNDKRKALLAQKVETVRAGLAAGASLDTLAAPLGGLRDTGLLPRSAVYVPPLGNEPRVLEKAFALKPGERTDSLQVAAGVAWVRVEEKKAGDAATYKTAAQQIELELLKKKYDAWVEERKKSVPIEILRADLKGPRPNPFGGMTVTSGG